MVRYFKSSKGSNFQTVWKIKWNWSDFLRIWNLFCNWLQYRSNFTIPYSELVLIFINKNAGNCPQWAAWGRYRFLPFYYSIEQNYSDKFFKNIYNQTKKKLSTWPFWVFEWLPSIQTCGIIGITCGIIGIRSACVSILKIQEYYINLSVFPVSRITLVLKSLQLKW